MDGVDVATVPGAERAATVVHRGKLETSAPYYQALAAFVENQGCTIDGHGRDVLINLAPDNPDDRIIEMQLLMHRAT
ncbi:MAG TPA: hypothetical protein VM282_03805 [Acidimicrobiales bacterium]|nr:hypothetical protein [Acidimicrobiales bacterium]